LTVAFSYIKGQVSGKYFAKLATPSLDMDPGDMKAGMPLRVPQNVLEEGLGQLRGEIAF
jgi:hypothetical protein